MRIAPSLLRRGRDGEVRQEEQTVVQFDVTRGGRAEMIKTALCDMLGIEYPLIQGPMGPFDTSDLAPAVSNAGGLGIISHHLPTDTPALMLGGDRQRGAIEEVEEIEVRAIHKVNRLTDKNFGQNFRASGTRQPDVPYLIEAMLEEREKNPELKKKFKLFISSAGDPAQPHLRRVKDYGMLWFCVVASAYHAKRAEDLGVDGIIAVGNEAGGHIGAAPFSTLTLIPEVVEAVKVPVVAGGGICDGKGFAAALALGAQGVYMASRFIPTKEMTAHQNLKEYFIKAGEKYRREAATIVTEGLYGPCRHVKNKYALELYELTEKERRGEATLEDVLRYETPRMFRAAGDGEVDEGPIWGSEVARRVHKIQETKEVIEEIIREASEVMKGLQGLVK